MDGDLPEHQYGAEIMGTAGEDAVDRGGRYSGVGNVLQGSGIGGTAVWIIVMGHVGSNGEYV